MKIVVSGYVGKKITGIGRNLINLLNAVNSNNEYVVYTNYDMEENMIFTNKNVVLKTYNISKTKSLENLLWTTFIFPIKVLKENADWALIPNFTLLIFKFRPTVVIMHDLIEFNISKKFSKKKMFYRTKLADPITAKRADKIITVSENSKKDIIQFLNVDESKITVIYNGVDREKFRPMKYEKAGYILHNKNWPSHFLLYVGTIDHPGKNALTVIKAFEHLRNQNYGGGLILAGMPGSGYEIVQDYAANSKYSKEIIFTGYVTDEQLIALYSRCDVFCFLSLYEGFGIPPLEAISCGAKVVVSNKSSLPEVVGKIGRSVDPLDIEQVRREILNEYHREIRSEEKDIINAHLSKFQWPILAKKFEKIFDVFEISM